MHTRMIIVGYLNQKMSWDVEIWPTTVGLIAHEIQVDNKLIYLSNHAVFPDA